MAGLALSCVLGHTPKLSLLALLQGWSLFFLPMIAGGVAETLAMAVQMLTASGQF